MGSVPSTTNQGKLSNVKAISVNEVLLEIIQQGLVEPFFQPILDLFNGQVIGYEVLARGVPPLESAPAMFEQARKMGLLWYLERVCRDNTFLRIRELSEAERNCRFFINISPDVFNDPRFHEAFSQESLAEFGLDQKRVILEITEEASEVDYVEFQDRIRHYTSQGFRISLDDFGAGSSSLVTLVAVTPHFLKLDKSIVRDIHKHNYKQLVLKTLVGFSGGVDTKLIAEGVENLDELDVLIRLGVRYAQGYMFAKPHSSPPVVEEATLTTIHDCVHKYSYAKVELDKTIVHLVTPACTIERGTLTCQEIDRMFTNDRTLDHIVILEGRKPQGLITREFFYVETAGSQWGICQLDPATQLCKNQPLVVEDRISVTSLSKLAMSRSREDLYDPIVVTDHKGNFIGTVTMKHIISRAAELEVNQAFGANPLTKLPGNRSIQEWIQEVLRSRDFAVVYGDLGFFKEYNDAYGFIMGDEMICLTSRILNDCLMDFHEEAKLGHVGGDDFIVVVPSCDVGDACKKVCDMFDEEKLKFFSQQDIDRGWYMSTNRQGHKAQTPLVTLSLAAITATSFKTEPHPAFLAGIAASLKKKLKKECDQQGRSCWMIERRKYD
jgi:diguanylate cyclase (GGDEF)-like protein